MDLATAQAHLDAALAAELAIVSSGQAYSIGEIAVTRARLEDIRTQITYWQSVVDGYNAAAAGGTSRYALASFGCVQ